jgi:uncharacterized protein YjhX (UPF0386 family)
MKTGISKAQQKIIKALTVDGAYLVDPVNAMGQRTGYVTTGGLIGYICAVKLSTFEILKAKGIISQNSPNGYYRLNPDLLTK